MISFGDDPVKDVKFSDSVDLKKTEMIIDDYDKKMFNYIATLYEAINGEKMDLEKVKNAVDALSQFNKKQEYNYLNNLLHPEKCKCVKIPSPIPVPSCSFQLHNSFTMTTNSLGNFCFLFNPFFLSSNKISNADFASIDTSAVADYQTISPSFYTSFFLNNSNELTGAASQANFNALNVGQCIEPIYDQYRLVSASIVVKYIGRLDIASGVIGGAVVFDENPYLGGEGEIRVNNNTALCRFVNTGLAKYGNFDLARDSYYHQENMCLEGLRMLYFPIDNSYEEYSHILSNELCNLTLSTYSTGFLTTDNDNLKNGFKYMVYVQGAPPSSACFKVDFFCNFECLPNAQYLNYLPLSMNLETPTPKEKKEAIMYIQKKPIMTIKEATDLSNSMAAPSIWDKMKKKFSDGLPSISKMIAKGLAQSVPVLKPGISLAGTMLGMQLED